ncbi:MAG: HAMP domain-containing protein [Acidobacterium ailaaui]|nr:HAMP domain-containing protein [Pseudacidobacterium ailaaui]MCL6464147.1 HAMP domain-containing protein [Pseudacidobacterium ailaaui]
MPVKHKRVAIVALGAVVLLLLLLFAALNAFNLNAFLYPHSVGAIFLFTALSVVVFLLFLILLVLFSRNVLKVYADRRSRVLGSRLRSRMLVGALLLSFAPAAFMFFFSFGLMNRSIDRWFSQPVAQLREDSTRIALELSHYVTQNARAEAESLARSESVALNFQAGNTNALLDEIRTHRITLQGGFAVLYRDENPVVQYQLPASGQKVSVQAWLDPTSVEVQTAQPLAQTIRKAAQRTDEPVLEIGDTGYALGMATMPGGGLVVVGLPMPSGLSSTVADIRKGAAQYWAVYRERRSIRSTYLLLLLLLTALTFFASSWLAWFFSKQITRPLESLAEAMDEIAEGHYHQRVNISATEELGELLQAFNHMAADLEQSRLIAEQSTKQLFEANAALEERRRELETILETIPGGVVTLDPDLRITQANQAFADLLPHGRPQSLKGLRLSEIFPEEISSELTLLSRRAQRMGVSSTELEMRHARGKLDLSATMAMLHLGQDRRGSVLVLENITEFLQAQRQVAWKEVAQRVAHEIKNPLTPIALSAERIQRHVERNTAESQSIIRSCSEIILSSVETLRRLVDQFAALAQFPTAQPRPSDLNKIVEGALRLFDGRLQGIHMDSHFTPDLPAVMADAEALKRAIANLIDNAAEAMQESRLRVLTITTGLADRHEMAEIVVSDTGHGLTDELRERLFLPYFSTKQRGTGLGLAIAAKIIQDHQGSIRAEQNYPAGARFIIELPLANGAVGVDSIKTTAQKTAS